MTYVRRHYRGGESTGPHQNPIHTRPNWQSYVIAHFSFFVWLMILCVLTVSYFLFYSNTFRITLVRVVGTSASTAHELYRDIIQPQLSDHRLLIIPQYSTTTFDSQKLESSIAAAYSVEDVSVKKSLFQKKLTITIVEKPPEIIWYSNSTYYYVDYKGDIAQIVTDISAVSDQYAQVIDQSNSPVSTQQHILDDDRIVFIRDCFTRMKNFSELPIFNFSLANNLSTQLIVHITDKPFVLYFDMSASLDTQLLKLERVLADDTLTAKNPQEYIDLRIGDKVYFK